MTTDETLEVTLTINGRLDNSDAAYLKKHGFRIDWRARTATGRLWSDQIRLHRMIADGVLSRDVSADGE